MWKQFTVQGNTQYLDMLPKMVKEYNNTKHSSIKMTPIEASKKKNLKSATELEYLSIKERLSTRVILQTGQKRFSQLIRSNTVIQSLIN